MRTIILIIFICWSLPRLSGQSHQQVHFNVQVTQHNEYHYHNVEMLNRAPTPRLVHMFWDRIFATK
jgi:hypothetical protein